MKSKTSSASWAASFFLVGLTAVIWWQKLAIYDFLRLRNYQPSAQVVALATNTTMKDSARHLFYVYHPSIEDSQPFNSHCSGQEKTIILGCYVKNHGIYLYKVTDTRLNGILEVTAAHEDLHAAYDRLSSRERTRIDSLLNETYANITDKRIRETIENYKKNGADINNELHSILGTEVRNLPQELEAYYGRYFTNRNKIVDYSEQYEAAFTTRQQRLADIEGQLGQLKIQIDGLESELQAEANALARDRHSVNNQAEANAFNARVDSYNEGVQQLNSLIRQYNVLVEEYKSLAIEQKSLYGAIDSHSTIAPE